MKHTPHTSHPPVSYLNYNGKILRDDKEIIKAGNRGFRYGDGLFETMKMVNGTIPLATLHFERLMDGIQVMKFNKPAYLTAEYLSKQIFELAKKNNNGKLVRIRLTVFRGEGGLYDAQNNVTNYIIQTWNLPGDNIVLNENGLVIDIFPDARIASDKFSPLKSNNYLPYVMGALYAKQNKLNDCLLLNTDGNICDATIANIFIIKGADLITPPLSEGCVAGVMRRCIIEHPGASQLPIIEKILSVTDLLEAEEVFLSNAIYGIRWVSRFRDAHYSNTETARIFCSIAGIIL